MNNIYKIIGCSILIFTLTACPTGSPNCFPEGGYDAYVDNLIKISNFQSIYNQGDVIIISLQIPSNNSFFTPAVNLLYQTYDFSATASFSNLTSIFTGNDVTIETGSQGQYQNWFEMPVNTTTGNYELKLKVKLNRLGSYSFTNTRETVTFQGEPSACNRYIIITNFADKNSQNRIEFTVQ